MSRRHGGAALVAALALVVAAVFGAAGWYLASASAPVAAGSAAPHDLQGRPVTLDAGTAPAPGVIQQMDVVDRTGNSLTISSVKLDVPLGELSMVKGDVTPPGFASAYLVRNLGVGLDAARTGTLYVVMHSLRNAESAPGNFLFDRATGRSRLSEGDLIRVGKLTYAVTSTSTEPKGTISDSPIWSNTAGRLVLITCLQLPGGQVSTSNFIVDAKLVG